MQRLGLDRLITRRDFIQGSLVSAALAGWSSALRSAPPGSPDAPGYYPPTLTGLRGSHAGSFEVAHALRDGRRWDSARQTDELYDLIVVGGGISGLAVAYFYRERVSRSSRILILENHDDFGGHARRNEFDLGGRMQLMNGGTWSIESPGPYSAVADGLVRKLGIDIATLAKTTQDNDFYASRGLHSAVFFDRETFGADKLVVRDEKRPWKEFLAHAPLTDAVRRDIERLEEGNVDYLPGLSSDEKKARLSAISFREYLTKIARSDPDVCAFYQARTHGLWCVGIEAISALDCWTIGLPGFQGLELRPGSIPRMGYTAAGLADLGWSEVVHFPDGNATIARALVRELIPAAAPAGDLAQLITVRFDYGKLDRPDAAVRLRLNSTATHVKNIDTKSTPEVDVTYVRSGTAFRARARHCVLACWNAVIPYLCPELPTEAENRTCEPREGPPGLHECRVAQLGAIREARHPRSACAGKLLLFGRLERGRAVRRVLELAQPRRAGPDPAHPDALRPGAH